MFVAYVSLRRRFIRERCEIAFEFSGGEAPPTVITEEEKGRRKGIKLDCSAPRNMV